MNDLTAGYISTFLPPLILVAFVFCLFFRGRNKKKVEREARTARLLEAYERFQREVEKVRYSTPFRMDPQYAREHGVILGKGEELIMHAPGLMTRTVRNGSRSTSGSRGVRITPVKGLSFNVGGSKARIVPVHEIQGDDGHFSITNKKLIFSGNTYNFFIQLKKVENIRVQGTEVFFDVTSRDVPDFYANFLTEECANIFATMLAE